LNLKETLKSIKLHEATISMVLGAVVIIIVGVVLVNYLAGRRGQTIPALQVGDEQTASAQEHTVAEGEDLWSISEKYYGTGFNWEDIAQANNITDPNQITEGQKLIIPDTEPKLAAQNVTPTVSNEEISEAEPTTEITESPKPTELASAETNEENNDAEKKTYVVQEGDNLWKIADAYYSSGYNWVDIAAENNIESPYVIVSGQELNIPESEAKVAAAETNSDQVGTISGDNYTVEKGDNLWDIAVRAYGDGYKWTDIAKENDLLHPSIIHPGNELTLPR